MLIILEGVDATGKSTLASEIADLVGAEVLHFKAPSQHPLVEYENSLLDFDSGTDRLVIDRFHWGERVWPTIFNRPSLYTKQMFDHTEMFLNSRGAVMIHCREDENVLVERIRHRGDELLSTDQATISMALGLFDEVSYQSHLPKFTFKISTASLFKLNDVVQEAEIRGLDCANTRRIAPEIIGNIIDPELLLVGDVAATEIEPGVPFPIPFVPYPATSGAWMLQSLTELDQIALVNSTTQDGHPDFQALRDNLGGPMIVALGRNAANVLDEQNVKHGTVPHPQYARRFFNKHVHEYAQAITRAGLERVDIISDFGKETSDA